jgi:polysaccharide biosynthesis transport protein
MAMNEDTSLPEPSPRVSSSMIRTTIPGGGLAAGWVESPTILDVQQPGNAGFAPYLHALRRRWLVALTVGTLCAMALVPAVWFLYAAEYTAEFWLKVSATEQRVLFNTVGPDTTFDIYKRTQQSSMKNPLVLMTALRDPAISGLSIVCEQTDDIWWLQRELEVDFPDDAELMRVRLKAKNKRDVAKVVNAVVDAYVKEIVDVEKAKKDARRQTLVGALGESERELEQKQEELRRLARTFGSADSETLALKQQNMLRELFEYRKEVASVDLQLMLDEAQTEGIPPEGGEKPESLVTEYELRMALRSDPDIRYFKQKLLGLEDQLNEIVGTTNSEVAAKYQERLQTDFDGVEAQIEARRETLRQELQLDKNELVKAETDNRDRATLALSLYKRRLNEQIAKLENEIDNLGGPTIDVLMRRKEVDILDQTVSTIASEVEKLKVERDSGGRIVIMSRDGAIARCTNQNLRIAVAILAGVVGFLLPALGIMFWDTRGQRVNSPGEISQETGLDVIGEIPIIPLRAVRHLVDSSPRYHHWHAMLTESVDGIAARLLRQAESDPVRVIMVSSAVSGEGKTTVATQLAMSLARTGHRTVLVDFDLRHPALDGVFGIPVQPGVGELLKHEIELADAVHSEQSDKLSVITAGNWSRGSVEVLANGSTSSLFDSLRSEYDFVIVDGSPLLPVADARFISQHVDGVVLSVLRDISRIPKVAAACELLAAFNVRTLGAVVTSAPQEQYYRNSRYQQNRGD